MKISTFLLLLSPLVASAFTPKVSKCPFGKLKKNFQPGGMTADDTTAAVEAQETLLSRIGGEDALNAAVDLFYDRLLEEESLQKYFVGVSPHYLKKHQFNFMRMAFTEIPDDVDVVATIRDGHSRLTDMGLNENDFDIVAGYLVGTFQDLGVAQDLIDEAVGIVGPLRAIFETEKE